MSHGFGTPLSTGIEPRHYPQGHIVCHHGCCEKGSRISKMNIFADFFLFLDDSSAANSMHHYGHVPKARGSFGSSTGSGTTNSRRFDQTKQIKLEWV